MLGFKSSQMGRNKKYSLGRYQIVLPPIDFFFGYQHFLMQMSPVFFVFFLIRLQH